MERQPRRSSIRDYNQSHFSIINLIDRFAAQRNFGLTIIRSLFFLNAGTLLLIYSYTHQHEKFPEAYPALIVAGIGILDCFLAGYFGWKHWIHEGTAEYTGNSTEDMDPSVKLSLTLTLCAFAMWIISIVIMLRYYHVI